MIYVLVFWLGILATALSLYAGLYVLWRFVRAAFFWRR